MRGCQTAVSVSHQVSPRLSRVDARRGASSTSSSSPENLSEKLCGPNLGAMVRDSPPRFAWNSIDGVHSGPPSPPPARFAASPTPEGLDSRLWFVDSLEKQIRELQTANKKLQRRPVTAPSARPSTTRPPLSPSARPPPTHTRSACSSPTHTSSNALVHSLEVEVAQLTAENNALQEEGLAFKQRMEGAVDQFEQLVARGEEEKDALREELASARQQLHDARLAQAASHTTEMAVAEAKAAVEASAVQQQRAAHLSYAVAMLGQEPPQAAAKGALSQWRLAAAEMGTEAETNAAGALEAALREKLEASEMLIEQLRNEIEHLKEEGTESGLTLPCMHPTD